KGVREHVHRPDAVEGVIALADLLEIARQRGRVAGNVDQTPGAQPQDVVNDRSVQSGPRRIDDHDAGRLAVRREGGESLSRLRADEETVPNSVQRRVPLRVPDRVGLRLHTSDLPRDLRGEDRYRPGPRIEIEDAVVRRELRRLE